MMYGMNRSPASIHHCERKFVFSWSSAASEGHGRVSVELLAGADVRRRVDEIRTRVDGIDTFPANAEKPVVKCLLC